MNKDIAEKYSYVVVGIVSPAYVIPTGELACQTLLLFHKESLALLGKRVIEHAPAAFTAAEIGEFIFSVSLKYGACDEILLSPTVWLGSKSLVRSQGFPDSIVERYSDTLDWEQMVDTERLKLEQFAKAGGQSLQWLKHDSRGVAAQLKALYHMMYHSS